MTVENLGGDLWLVEVRIPDDSLEGDAWHEMLELRETEFELMER